jgi:Holliday junction DNA helicase RuvA
MIASVRGVVARVGLGSVVLEVGGVGLLLHTTPATAASLRTGAAVSLATSLVVREDSLTLYGFPDEDARSVFETVQTVSGVGPRLALAMLAVLSPDAIRIAVTSGDIPALIRVPGIGKKGAERIVLELRDAMGGPAGTTPGTTASVGSGWQGQVREALVGLGWSAKQAEDAVEAVRPQADTDASVSALLRAALQSLAKA